MDILLRFTTIDDVQYDVPAFGHTHQEAMDQIEQILTQCDNIIEGIICKVDNIWVDNLPADDVRAICKMDLSTLPHNLRKYDELIAEPCEPDDVAGEDELIVAFTIEVKRGIFNNFQRGWISWDEYTRETARVQNTCRQIRNGRNGWYVAA